MSVPASVSSFSEDLAMENVVPARVTEEEIEAEEEEEEDSMCGICFENDPNVMTPCKHHFCKDCLEGWYEAKKKDVTCPLCRAQLPSLETLFSCREDLLASSRLKRRSGFPSHASLRCRQLRVLWRSIQERPQVLTTAAVEVFHKVWTLLGVELVKCASHLIAASQRKTVKDSDLSHAARFMLCDTVTRVDMDEYVASARRKVETFQELRTARPEKRLRVHSVSSQLAMTLTIGSEKAFWQQHLPAAQITAQAVVFSVALKESLMGHLMSDVSARIAGRESQIVESSDVCHILNVEE